MLQAVKQAKEINSFVEVYIPPVRDLYARYGERLSSGVYSSSPVERSGISAPVRGQSTIERLIRAQKMLEKEVSTP